MKRLSIAIPFLLTGCAALHEPLEDAYLVSHTVDTIQTMQIAKYPDIYHEGKSCYWLGAHPSRESVWGWAIGSAAVQLGGTQLLLASGHPRLARIWEASGLIVSLDAVNLNYHVGIKIGNPQR